MNLRCPRSILCGRVAVSLLLFACGDDTGTGTVDGRASDMDTTTDAPVALDTGPSLDSPPPADDLPHDAGWPELTQPDAGPDAGPVDGASAPPDAALDSTSDTSADSAPDQSPPPGLSVPCQNGPGWTLFRFHWGGGGTSPAIDVWDASCSYSYAPNSACNVYAIYPGFGEVSYTSEGYPIFTTTQYMRVRFSVTGLSFSGATVHIAARSYSTSASTNFRVWSPLYGDVTGGPVDNDWIYDWYAVDWTGFLFPSDPPSLTAIQVYASTGSANLAVKAVELCVQ